MNSTRSNKQFLLIALGLAVFARFLAMPFFAHVDLFSEARRVYFALENGYLLENSHRIVVYYIELLFSSLSLLFVDVTEGLFHLDDPKNSTASLVDYGFFLNDPYIYRYLFLFKLPYLIFDIATALVIWKFVDDVKLKRLAIVLWLFNPVTFFATYIFGRFEVIGLFFLALTALQLKHRQFIWACMAFVLALHSREINLLFLPFLLLALLDHKDPILRNIIVSILAGGLILFLYWLPDPLLGALGGNTDLFVPAAGVHDTNTVKKLMSMGYYWFFPIIVCMAGLALYAWERGNDSHEQRYVICCAVALFIYFGFNVHSIHYAAWLTLFPILSLQFNRKIVLPFLIFAGIWVVLWLFKTDHGVFTLFLAAPLSPELMSHGYFPAYFNQHFASPEFNLVQAVSILRSLFFVSMAFFAYRLLRSHAN